MPEQMLLSGNIHVTGEQERVVAEEEFQHHRMAAKRVRCDSATVRLFGRRKCSEFHFALILCNHRSENFDAQTIGGINAKSRQCCMSVGQTAATVHWSAKLEGTDIMAQSRSLRLSFYLLLRAVGDDPGAWQ